MRSKKAIKNIITSLILQAVSIICGFIIPRLIIEKFGSEINGLISSITQFLGYITLLEVGLGPVVKSLLYKPIANNNKEKIQNILKATEKFFKKIAYIFIIYIVILLLIYPIFVNQQFDTLFTISLIIIISISTFAEYFFGITYMLYLQAEQKTYVVSYIQIFSKVINLLLIVILIYFGANILVVKLISSLVFIIKPILQNIYVKKVYKINLKYADKNYKIEKKWDGLAQHIAYVIFSNTDITVITIFLNVLEVSVYSVYMLVINGTRSVMNAFSSGIEALFGDMIAKKENMNNNLAIYELAYYILITFVCVSTSLLIVPFIEIYTKGITDVEYIRPLFAITLVLNEFIDSVRRPYNGMVMAAGKFRETQLGAWIEAIVNIVLSCLLVTRFGIIGVAIGTLIANSIRTIEIVYYSSKNIIDRKPNIILKRVTLSIVQSIVIIFIIEFTFKMKIYTYIDFIKYAIIVAIISLLIIVPSSLIIYKKDTKRLLQKVKLIRYGLNAKN